MFPGSQSQLASLAVRFCLLPLALSVVKIGFYEEHSMVQLSAYEEDGRNASKVYITVPRVVLIRSYSFFLHQKDVGRSRRGKTVPA